MKLNDYQCSNCNKITESDKVPVCSDCKIEMEKRDYVQGRDHLYEKEVPTDSKLFVINNLVQLDLF